MRFHIGFLRVFPFVDFCWGRTSSLVDCPYLPLGWGRLLIEVWANVDADGLNGDRKEFEGVTSKGRAREVADRLFGRKWAVDVDVEGSAELGRVLLLMLRAPGENEDVDGEFEKWRVAEGGTFAVRLRVVVGERGTFGKREDVEDAMLVATGNTVGVFGGIYCGKLGGPDRDAPGSSGVEIVYCVVSSGSGDGVGNIGL